MKPRSLFINASRGMVVDDVSLRENILSGHIAGAALDVFPVEPKAQGDEFESALRGLPNVILTPHVGGSTQEAQEEIGYFVSGKLSALRPRRQHGAVGQPARGRRSRRSRAASGSRCCTTTCPGVLASVNQVLADQQANVTAQYLATRGEQGYVVTDVADRAARVGPRRAARGRVDDLAAHLPRPEPLSELCRWAARQRPRAAAATARRDRPVRRPAPDADRLRRDQSRAAPVGAVAGLARRHDAGAQVAGHGVVDAGHPRERARVGRAADAGDERGGREQPPDGERAGVRRGRVAGLADQQDLRRSARCPDTASRRCAAPSRSGTGALYQVLPQVRNGALRCTAQLVRGCGASRATATSEHCTAL